MELVFDGTLSVHYGFAYLTEPEPDIPSGLDFFFAGQQNGICGAALPQMLCMITGTHTGDVAFRVEWHAEAPPLDAAWEDVVEVSTEVRSVAAQLSTFDDYQDVTLASIGSHRVRYCAVGMDAVQEVDDEPPDRYLVQLWPAAMSPDEIIRVNTERARYWHDQFGGSPALTEEQLAAILTEHDGTEFGEIGEFGSWGPDDGDHVDAVTQLLALDAAVRRDTARWLARRAVEEAGLAAEPRFEAALQALSAGRPLPAPFDDLGVAMAVALAIELPGATTESDDDVSTVNDPEPDDDFGWYGDDEDPEDEASRRNRVLVAVSALDAAADGDDIRAAIGAYRYAMSVFGPDGSLLVDELRERLSPSLDD